MPAWAAWLCLAVGVTLVGTSLVSGWRTMRLVAFGEKAIGTVVDFAAKGSITASYPIFTFTDASGKARTETSTVSVARAGRGHSIGDTVPIRFDPRQGRLQEDTFNGLWVLPVVAGVIGTVAFAAGLLLKKMRHNTVQEIQ